jgi:hypothetical protein
VKPSLYSIKYLLKKKIIVMRHEKIFKNLFLIRGGHMLAAYKCMITS